MRRFSNLWIRKNCSAIAVGVALFASSTATAQPTDNSSDALPNAQAAAHQFVAEALGRAEARYDGKLRKKGSNGLTEFPSKIEGPFDFTEYVGSGCKSTIRFGHFELKIDWSRITDIDGYQMLLAINGRFPASRTIDKHYIAFNSTDLASRVGAAATVLQKSCDDLGRLGAKD